MPHEMGDLRSVLASASVLWLPAAGGAPEHPAPSSSHRPSPAASCPRSKAVALRLADAAQLMGSLQRVP